MMYHLNIPVVVCNIQGIIQSYNRAFTEYIGLSGTNIVGQQVPFSVDDLDTSCNEGKILTIHRPDKQIISTNALCKKKNETLCITLNPTDTPDKLFPKNQCGGLIMSITEGKISVKNASDEFYILTGIEKNNADTFLTMFENHETLLHDLNAASGSFVWEGQFNRVADDTPLYLLLALWNHDSMWSGTLVDVTGKHLLDNISFEPNAKMKSLTDKIKRQDIKALDEQEFTRIITHEIRNPLSGIDSCSLFLVNNLNLLSAAEAISQVKLRELAKILYQDAVHIRNCTNFVKNILNDVLDLSSLEIGRYKFVKHLLDLRKHVINIVVSSVVRKRPEVKLLVSCPDGVIVESDALSLQHILINLVNDALKHTITGFVRIEAKRDGAILLIAVSDSGPGISSKEQLFCKTAKMDVRHQGSGVSLALCAAMVHAMQGSIHLDESYDDPVNHTGSRFVIKLPLPKVELPQNSRFAMQDSSEKTLPSGMLVLVCEDSALGRATIIRRLENLTKDWKFVECASGEEAIELCSKPKTYYDLIIVDQILVDGGGKLLGHEVVKTLREKGIKSVIFGSSGDDVKGLHMNAGANAVWRKPLPDNDEILSSLSEYLKMPANLKILVCDDSLMNRKMLIRMLRKSAHPSWEFFEAESGEETLDLVEKTKYDVVIIDEYMGNGLKGSDTMRTLRTRGFDSIVVGYSGSDMGSVHKVAGADLFWKKDLDDSDIMINELAQLYLKTQNTTKVGVKRKLVET